MSPGLRLGVIGCGDIAGYIAWFSRLTPGLRLAACCDRDKEKAQSFARRHHIPQAYTDYQELISQVELDALYIAVPHHLHAEMLSAAVSDGLPTLIEKPITRTLAEGIRVSRLAEQRGVKVGVNYQYRYDSGIYALAQAVQSGTLGQIHAVRANLPWRRSEQYFTQAPWHARLDTSGGGTLLTQGSHLIDAALWALDEQAISAQGMIARRAFQQAGGKPVEVEDLAQAILELHSGVLFQINSLMLAAREGSLSLEVYGSQGTAIYTDRPWPRVRFQGVSGHHAHPPAPGLHALQRSLAAFRNWVQEGRPYLIPAAQALPALAAVEAIYQSAQSGARVAVIQVETGKHASIPGA